MPRSAPDGNGSRPRRDPAAGAVPPATAHAPHVVPHARRPDAVAKAAEVVQLTRECAAGPVAADVIAKLPKPRPIQIAAPWSDGEPAHATGDVDPAAFVSEVQPLLEADDLPGLVELLDANYTRRQICRLLRGAAPDEPEIVHDARNVAALALSLVGGLDCVDCLVARLRDPDPMTNGLVEHALWCIWFRGGSHEANAHLMRGSEALDDRQLDRAVAHFTAAVALSPDFAEAYNQRAMVRYLTESFDESLHDCLKAAELMPCHFGAWSGAGHCYAHLGRLTEALRCYRRAVAINPHLACVCEMIRELEAVAEATAANGPARPGNSLAAGDWA